VAAAVPRDAGFVAGTLWALVMSASGAAQRNSTLLSATAAVAAVLVVAASAYFGRRHAGSVRWLSPLVAAFSTGPNVVGDTASAPVDP
jgi:hypothetical protein